jgi:hypothetical protein
MRGVSLQIGSVAIGSGFVEVIVLFHELFELGLDVCNLVGGELVFIEGYFGLFEVAKEAKLAG